MNRPDDQPTREAVTALVRKLFAAENERNRDEADKILSSDYVPITRGTGQADRDRAETLSKIAGGRAEFRRLIDRAKIDVALFVDGRVAIATSLLPTEDGKDKPPTLADYRNTQVFVKEDNGWRCVAWQVTKVAK